MPAVWFDNPFANAATAVLAAIVVLIVARRLIISAAYGPDRTRRRPRRPGTQAIPPAIVCPSQDCAAPNRPDALFCRRCGTRLGGGAPGGGS